MATLGAIANLRLKRETLRLARLAASGDDYTLLHDGAHVRECEPDVDAPKTIDGMEMWCYSNGCRKAYEKHSGDRLI